MNNFLAILESYAFQIEYKKVKFTAINFCGRTSEHSFCDFVKIPQKFLPSLVKNNY